MDLDDNNYLNVQRLCGHAIWVFIYWLEYIDKRNLSEEQSKFMYNLKINYVGWLISTSGYFDKSIDGNWKKYTNNINEGTIIEDVGVILNTDNFKQFIKMLYYNVINRTNIQVCLLHPIFFNNDNNIPNIIYNEVIECKKYILQNYQTNVKINTAFAIELNANKLFKACNYKDIIIINLFADLIRDHYNSGKVKEYYNKYSNYDNNTIIPSFKSVSSIELPYTFGNGINEQKYNNFFEMLEYIKTLIDEHKDYYDIAIISAGVYTSFIADYIDKIKCKKFISCGRGLNNIFCIKYKHTDYSVCDKFNIEPYLCDIPNKYKLKNYYTIEEGCYW